MSRGKSCRTICSQRLLLTAPRSSMSSLKGSGFVGSSFFFSGRTTVSKSGSGWALNCGTWKVQRKHIFTLLYIAILFWRSKGISSGSVSPPLHFASLPASSLSVPSSLVPSLQRRMDRPPQGGSLVTGAGRGGQSEGLEGPSLVRAVLPGGKKLCLGEIELSTFKFKAPKLSLLPQPWVPYESSS